MILKRIDCQALIVLDGGLYKCDEMKEGHLGPHRSNRARAQWRTCGHWSATDE